MEWNRSISFYLEWGEVTIGRMEGGPPRLEIRTDPFKSVTMRKKRLVESANIRPFTVKILAWAGARSYPKIEKDRNPRLESLLCWNVSLRFLGHFIGYRTMGDSCLRLFDLLYRDICVKLSVPHSFPHSLEFSNLKSIYTEEELRWNIIVIYKRKQVNFALDYELNVRKKEMWDLLA